MFAFLLSMSNNEFKLKKYRQQEIQMTTLTLTEQLTLEILESNTGNDIQEVHLKITEFFKTKQLGLSKVKILREACTEKLKELSYKKCGGTGR